MLFLVRHRHRNFFHHYFCLAFLSLSCDALIVKHHTICLATACAVEEIDCNIHISSKGSNCSESFNILETILHRLPKLKTVSSGMTLSFVRIRHSVKIARHHAHWKMPSSPPPSSGQMH